MKKQFVSNNAFSSIRRVIKLEMPEFPLEFYYMREARRRVVVAFRGGRMPIDVVSMVKVSELSNVRKEKIKI